MPAINIRRNLIMVMRRKNFLLFHIITVLWQVYSININIRSSSTYISLFFSLWKQISLFRRRQGNFSLLFFSRLSVVNTTLFRHDVGTRQAILGLWREEITLLVWGEVKQRKWIKECRRKHARRNEFVWIIIDRKSCCLESSTFLSRILIVC